MHFLITGHTGFKGSWLSLLLAERGHTISGMSLDAIGPSLFEMANLRKFLADDIRCDIRNGSDVSKIMKMINPDVIIHLAAQALVRESYRSPMATYETNALGTLNLLNAARQLDTLRALLVVTTDKVYKKKVKAGAYFEADALGGRDPYSASKAMADIATQSWISSFKGAPTAIARAGNVIGGGDFALDRLIPDLVKSYSLGEVPKLRSPRAIRPWQHVLDCLNGYIHLVETLLDGKGEGVWNFGPSKEIIRTVSEVSELAGLIWGAEVAWEADFRKHPHEEEYLLLDSSKAREILGWEEKLSFEESVKWATCWYKNVYAGGDPLEESLQNIRDFERL